MKLPGLALLSLLTISGCTTVDNRSQLLSIDPALAQRADNYHIDKKDAFWPEDQLNVSMGPYRITNADQGSKRTTSTGSGMDFGSIFDFDSNDYTSKQRLNFDFVSEQGLDWSGRCEKRFKGSESSIRVSHTSTVTSHTLHNVAYQCVFKANEYSLVLQVEQNNRYGSKAFIQSPDNKKWFIESFRQSVSHPFGEYNRYAPGFYIMDEGVNLAAVSIDEQGQFWLDQNLPSEQKDMLAVSAIGLWYLRNGFYDE